MSHGGINDIKRHVEGAVHQQKYKDSQGCTSISSLFGRNQQQRLIHASNILSAELKMAQFIALFISMFPDSAIASDFACKRTNTKAIICDALDPHMKTAVVDIVKSTAFSL